MAILWIAMSFCFPEKEKLVIRLEHYVGNDVLKLDSETYKNELGQAFTVTNFKYYISNIHLKRADGKEFSSGESFLVNEEDAASKIIGLNDVPEGTYTSIDLILGVDSLHNCSGAQSGALDPVNAMFWAWNTGYIFLKLEGKSPASTSPGHIFEYHIGGYKQPNNCIRKIKLDFSHAITIKNTTGLTLKADAAELLKRL